MSPACASSLDFRMLARNGRSVFTIPCLVMTTIAWYMRVGVAFICLIVLFAVAVGIISFQRTRAARHLYRRAIGPNQFRRLK